MQQQTQNLWSEEPETTHNERNITSQIILEGTWESVYKYNDKNCKFR